MPLKIYEINSILSLYLSLLFIFVVVYYNWVFKKKKEKIIDKTLYFIQVTGFNFLAIFFFFLSLYPFGLIIAKLIYKQIQGEILNFINDF